jgi:hypothetical protein
MSYEFSQAEDISYFERPENIYKHLAKRLAEGRLSLALGAGVSVGLGLPGWRALLERCFSALGSSVPVGTSDQVVGDRLLSLLGGDRARLAELLRQKLYENFRRSLRTMQENKLLVALGALIMSASRSNLVQIISFNYDDLLEVYLSYHGFVVVPVYEMPTWASRADATIFHPHGFLLSTEGTQPMGRIVLSQLDYDDGQNQWIPWKNLIIDRLSSTTPLFIGLSGNDQNLTGILAHLKDTHVSRRAGEPFWGFRIALDSDDTSDEWEMRGVGQLSLTSYDEIPNVLLKICQLAADIRSQALSIQSQLGDLPP